MNDATDDHEFAALIDAAAEAGDLLHRYIEVHDRIFKTSLRHIIPIPGIFKPINYQQHFESLRFIEMSLAEVMARVTNSPLAANEFATTLRAYLTALLDAIVQLRRMCGNLFQKADRTLIYSKAEYDRDLRDYRECVLRYQRIGSQVNAYFGR